VCQPSEGAVILWRWIGWARSGEFENAQLAGLRRGTHRVRDRAAFDVGVRLVPVAPQLDPTGKDHALITALAETDFLRLAELCSIAGDLYPRTAQKRINALKARGLLEGNGHTGFWLTDAGRQHPAAAAVKAAQDRVAIDQAVTRSTIDLELEHQEIEAARLQAESAGLHADAAEHQAREMRARRAAIGDEHAIGRQLLRHNQAIAEREDEGLRAARRKRAADLVRGLTATNILQLVGNGTIEIEDLPGRTKNQLFAAAEELARQRGWAARGLDAIMLTANVLEQQATEQARQPKALSPAPRRRPRATPEAEPPAFLMRLAELAWSAQPQLASPSIDAFVPRNAPAFLRRRPAVPAVPLPKSPTVEQEQVARERAESEGEYRQRAMRAGWRWRGSFSEPPVCEHEYQPGRCPQSCRLPR
jgi:hypothetical protein